MRIRAQDVILVISMFAFAGCSQPNKRPNSRTEKPEVTASKPAEGQIAALLAGDKDAVDQLAQADHEEWIPLVEFLLDEPSATPAFVRALWDVQPDLNKWLQNIDRALEAFVRAQWDTQPQKLRIATSSSGKKILLPWLRDSLVSAFPPTHEAVLEMRIKDLRGIGRDDGGFADAKTLHQDLIKYDASAKRLAQVALLVTRGAFTARNYDAARQYSTLAIESYDKDGDERGANLAKRYLASALLHLRQWDRAFKILDEALVARSPLFGGGGVTVFASSSDPKEEAIREVQAIALWTSKSVPEWVRALGGLTEAFADDPILPELQRRYEEGLALLAKADAPLDEFEVVIRQLRERSFHRAAAVAAQIAAEAYPGDSWIHSVYGNIASELNENKTAYVHYLASAKLLDGAKSKDAGAAWINVGDAAAELGDHKSANKAFKRAYKFAKTDGARREVDFYVARSLRKRDPKAARKKAYSLFKELSKDARLLAEFEFGPPTVDLLLDC